jgi:hypothetical protein
MAPKVQSTPGTPHPVFSNAETLREHKKVFGLLKVAVLAGQNTHPKQKIGKEKSP